MGEVRRPTYTTTDPASGEKVRKQSRVWWIRYYRNGRRHEESSHSTKKGEAERLLKIREGDVASGKPVTADAARYTFDEAAAAVVTDYKLKGNKSLPGVERRIRLHLEPYFGGRRLASITTDLINNYTLQRQEADAANATIRRELAVLKRAFRLAAQAGKAMHVPHIPMPGNDDDNIRTGFFERGDFEDVRDALPPELRGVVTFAYLTGWRVPSEVLTLEWRQVDREAQTVTLDPGTTKNKEGRVLPYGMLSELVEVIDTAWTTRQRLAKEGTLCPYVFHRDGKPIKSMREAWKSATKAAGVPGKLVHDFRRTAARNLIRAGVSEPVAMKITGHKTPSVFRRYNITAAEDVEKGLGALAGAAGKEKGKIRESGRVAEISE